MSDWFRLLAGQKWLSSFRIYSFSVCMCVFFSSASSCIFQLALLSWVYILEWSWPHIMSFTCLSLALKERTMRGFLKCIIGVLLREKKVETECLEIFAIPSRNQGADSCSFFPLLCFFLILCLYFYFGSESRGKWQKMMASIVSEIERGPQRLHCTGGLACLPLPFSHCFTGAWGSGHSSCSFSTWTLSSVRLQSFSSFVG